MSILAPDWLVRILRRSRREKALRQAAAWPLVTAQTLASKVVPKDLAADQGTSFQTFQIETAFYFTLPGEAGGCFGGRLRSTPLSDSEAHRLLPRLAEDTLLHVRYNPANPDDNHILPTDNPATLPYEIWPM